MLHVFYIHSHTSFLVSMGVIKQLKLKDNDVLFLTARHYKNSMVNVPYKQVDISNLLFFKKWYHFSYWNQRRYISSLDQVIDTYVKGCFSVYVPHVASYGFQVLTSNKRCCCINLCQESAYSFFKKEKWTYKLICRKILLSLTNRLWAQTNWYPPRWMYKVEGGVKTWAVNADYFKPLTRAEQHVVVLPKFEIEFDLKTDKPMFVFEAAVDQNSIEEDVYLDGCKALIQKCGEAENYVKFHPAQTEISRKKIIELFKKREVEILPDEVPFEMIISQFENLKIMGFHSSLIKFAKEAGHQVVSYEDYLIERSAKFKNFVKSHT